MTELIEEFSSILNNKNTKIFTSSTKYKCYYLDLNNEDLLYILNIVDDIDFVIKTIISESENKYITLIEYDDPMEYYNSNRFNKVCKHIWRVDWGSNYKYNLTFEITYKICSPYFSTIYEWINNKLFNGIEYITYEEMTNILYK